MMSGGIKTPVFFQPRETIFRDSSQKEIKDVHDDDQTVNLGEREKNEIKEISTEVDGRSPLLEDLPMLFVVLFMITFCIVQLSCGLFGLQTDNFLLMMVSTLSSLGGITGYWMKSVRQETKQGPTPRQGQGRPSNKVIQRQRETTLLFG